MNEDERAESVVHCKWVDEVIPSAPWVITPEYIKQHKIEYVCHDAAPYADASGQSSSAEDVYKFVKDAHMFIPTSRTEGISTTDLINRIVRDYNDFVLRNLQRGMSREELNVSWTREKRIKLDAQMKKMGKQMKEVGDRMEHQFDEIKANIRNNVEDISFSIGRWIDVSQKRAEDFLKLYGKLGDFFKEQREKLSLKFSELAQSVPM